MLKSNQISFVSLNELIPENHQYRKFKKLWNFDWVNKILKNIDLWKTHVWYWVKKLFLCLLIQFMEDLSDRELEKYLAENLAGKWFCWFKLTDKTPDHSIFTRARKKIWTNQLSKIFEDLKNQLSNKGYMSEVFTFVDASHLVTKANLWEERDKWIKEWYEKMNNETLPKVANDKEAKIWSKWKNKFWYGYKKHASVDMQSWMINKIAITQANVTDAKWMKHVLPNSWAVYADKWYCIWPAILSSKKKWLHLCAIKKNNMKEKDKDKDRFYSKLRPPYERVFSKMNHRVRYKSVVKNQFTAFMEAISFNLKRLVVLEEVRIT